MGEQILLLKLLTIPVLIIKFLSRTVSMLTYLPNYILILGLDSFIFSHRFQSSFAVYCIMWPFRFIALNLVTALFCLEFFAIYHFLDIYDKALYTQTLAMSLTIGGLLFLMRKGYLRMVASFNSLKLKSPLQHLQAYQVLLLDILGLLLALANILLISYAHKTFSYRFVSQEQINRNQTLDPNPFLTHIKKTIHSSLLYNLTFFYVKIFFKLFPWRYNHNMQFIQKQQQNILNLMVLLTLLWLQTLLDIVVVALLGWVCLLHSKRNLFKTRLKLQEQKYQVTLKHFSLILLQTVQLTLTVPCILLNPHPTIQHIKLLLQPNSQGQPQQFTPDSYFPSTLKHIYCSLIKIPAYFSLSMIWLCRYKYKKLQTISLPDIATAAKPMEDYDIDVAYMVLFAEQIVDAFFLPLILACTLANPLTCKWLKMLINDKYDLDRQLVGNFFVRTITQLFLWIPAAIVLTLSMSFYCPSHIFLVIKGYYYLVTSLNLESYIKGDSQWLKYSQGLFHKLSIDLPFLPLYFLANISFLTLFDCETSPSKVYDSYQKYIKMFYLYRVKSSHRSQTYVHMFNQDLASGIIQNQGHKMRFWKFAHKCERHIMLTKCLQLLVPKRKYEKKIALIQKPDHMSSISNEYWYRLSSTHKMLEIFAAFMVQVVVGLFGLIVLAPLTLWRLPTFIQVFNIHRSKRLFFPVIFTVYKLMLADLLFVWMHLLALAMAPRTFVRFRMGTIFRYGRVGVTELLDIERKKNHYIWRVIILQTLKVYRLAFEVVFIYVIHLRKHSYLNELKRNTITFAPIKKSLLTGPQVPSFDQLMKQNYAFEQIKFGKFKKITDNYFRMSLVDVPFLLIAAFCLTIMPWRYFYLKKAVKEMKQCEGGRRQVVIVMRNVFKDYLCILMNILLLLSGVKSHKAIALIKRNYRLNFFVGFLKYSFLNELQYELKQAAFIYFSVVLILISLVLDWQHAPQLITRLYAFYKQHKEAEQTKRENEKIYKNTVKQKKDLRLLDQIGFYEYVTLCQFLDVKDLAQLTQVSKMNYMILEREEIWIEKWENSFSPNYQNIIKGDTFKLRCIKAYQLDTLHTRPTKLTFNELSRQLFIHHIYEQKTSIPYAIQPLLPEKVQQKVYKNYEWSIHEGYGPQNQLPQEQNEDEEFLRLTNQVRRQKVWLVTDFMFCFNYLVVCPIEWTSQCLNMFYRIDSHRRKKQLLFILMIVGSITSWVYYLYLMLCAILQITKWAGVLTLLLVYSFTFVSLIYERLSCLYRQEWVSLKPFNLYTDVRDGLFWTVNFVRIKFLLVKDWFSNKVYTPVRDRVLACARFIAKWVQKIAKSIADKVKLAAKIFVDKIAVPLYVSCVKKLIILKNFIITVYKTTKSVLIFILSLLKKLVMSFYQAIVIILRNMNGIYFKVLLQGRNGLMRFGMFGQLIFTILGLVVMLSPSITCYVLYWQRWSMIVSTVHSAILMVLGYKHLNKIKMMNV